VAEHWFTPATARQALDALRPTAETLHRLVREMECARPARIRPDQPVDPAYFLLVTRLHTVLSEIRRSGVQVQDLRGGLLGFPARRAGRPVVLSWRVGERTLGFWHESGPGGGDRRPLDDDGPWDAG
jgi:hypothetical protein